MPKATAQLETRTQTLVRTFEEKGRTFEVHRDPEGKGFTQQQSINLEKSRPGTKLLTKEKAEEVRDTPELNEAFKNALNPGEWTHVRDKEAENRSWTAGLCHGGNSRRLYVNDDAGLDDAAPVVVLEKIGSEAAAPQAKYLRPTEGEILEVTLSDGQKLRAIEAVIRRK